jgi:hypothetical protein
MEKTNPRIMAQLLADALTPVRECKTFAELSMFHPHFFTALVTSVVGVTSTSNVT